VVVPHSQVAAQRANKMDQLGYVSMRCLAFNKIMERTFALTRKITMNVPSLSDKFHYRVWMLRIELLLEVLW
jgi:hypothetical protein